MPLSRKKPSEIIRERKRKIIEINGKRYDEQWLEACCLDNNEKKPWREEGLIDIEVLILRGYHDRDLNWHLTSPNMVDGAYNHMIPGTMSAHGRGENGEDDRYDLLRDRREMSGGMMTLINTAISIQKAMKKMPIMDGDAPLTKKEVEELPALCKSYYRQLQHTKGIAKEDGKERNRAEIELGRMGAKIYEAWTSAANRIIAEAIRAKNNKDYHAWRIQNKEGKKKSAEEADLIDVQPLDDVPDEELERLKEKGRGQ